MFPFLLLCLAGLVFATPSIHASPGLVAWICDTSHPAYVVTPEGTAPLATSQRDAWCDDPPTPTCPVTHHTESCIPYLGWSSVSLDGWQGRLLHVREPPETTGAWLAGSFHTHPSGAWIHPHDRNATALALSSAQDGLRSILLLSKTSLDALPYLIVWERAITYAPKPYLAHLRDTGRQIRVFTELGDVHDPAHWYRDIRYLHETRNVDTGLLPLDALEPVVHPDALSLGPLIWTDPRTVTPEGTLRTLGTWADTQPEDATLVLVPIDVRGYIDPRLSHGAPPEFHDPQSYLEHQRSLLLQLRLVPRPIWITLRKEPWKKSRLQDLDTLVGTSSTLPRSDPWPDLVDHLLYRWLYDVGAQGVVHDFDEVPAHYPVVDPETKEGSVYLVREYKRRPLNPTGWWTVPLRNRFRCTGRGDFTQPSHSSDPACVWQQISDGVVPSLDWLNDPPALGEIVHTWPILETHLPAPDHPLPRLHMNMEWVVDVVYTYLCGHPHALWIQGHPPSGCMATPGRFSTPTLDVERMHIPRTPSPLLDATPTVSRHGGIVRVAASTTDVWCDTPQTIRVRLPPGQGFGDRWPYLDGADHWSTSNSLERVVTLPMKGRHLQWTLVPDPQWSSDTYVYDPNAPCSFALVDGTVVRTGCFPARRPATATPPILDDVAQSWTQWIASWWTQIDVVPTLCAWTHRWDVQEQACVWRRDGPVVYQMESGTNTVGLLRCSIHDVNRGDVVEVEWTAQRDDVVVGTGRAPVTTDKCRTFHLQLPDPARSVAQQPGTTPPLRVSIQYWKNDEPWTIGETIRWERDGDTWTVPLQTFGYESPIHTSWRVDTWIRSNTRPSTWVVQTLAHLLPLGVSGWDTVALPLLTPSTAWVDVEVPLVKPSEFAWVNVTTHPRYVYGLDALHVPDVGVRSLISQHRPRRIHMVVDVADHLTYATPALLLERIERVIQTLGIDGVELDIRGVRDGTDTWESWIRHVRIRTAWYGVELHLASHHTQFGANTVRDVLPVEQSLTPRRRETVWTRHDGSRDPWTCITCRHLMPRLLGGVDERRGLWIQDRAWTGPPPPEALWSATWRTEFIALLPTPTMPCASFRIREGDQQMYVWMHVGSTDGSWTLTVHHDGPLSKSCTWTGTTWSCPLSEPGIWVVPVKDGTSLDVAGTCVQVSENRLRPLAPTGMTGSTGMTGPMVLSSSSTASPSSSSSSSTAPSSSSSSSSSSSTAASSSSSSTAPLSSSSTAASSSSSSTAPLSSSSTAASSSSSSTAPSSTSMGNGTVPFESKRGYSTGAIIGISVGTVAAVGLVGGAIYMQVYRTNVVMQTMDRAIAGGKRWKRRAMRRFGCPKQKRSDDDISSNDPLLGQRKNQGTRRRRVH